MQQADRKVIEWGVRVRVKQGALGGSFSVLIFVGPVSGDPSQWRSSPSYVGSHSIFGGYGSSDDTLTEGFVYITNKIAERSRLPSLDPSSVVPYLKGSLRWRVQAADGTTYPTTQVPSLQIDVYSAPITHPPGAIFPVIGPQTWYSEITAGRTGD